MLTSFIDSWALFANAWLSSWLIAVLLSLLGVAVLARNQIFLGAAMSQAATAGVALVLCVAGNAHTPWLTTASAIVAVLAAIVTAVAAGMSRGHRESVIGWIFLACAAAAMLLVARSPHGTEEINRLMASSVIGATRTDVVLFTLMVASVVAVITGWGSHLCVLLLDPAFAAAIGIRVRRWNLLIAVALGLALGWSLHVAGMLYTFGMLILPAMAARHLARELRTMAFFAPMIALTSAIVASICADAWDLPPAQMTVGLLAVVVGICAGIGKLKSIRFV